MKNAIKETVRIGIRKGFAILYRMLWIFPVRKKLIFFQSYEKAIGYCGNPKYLCEYLLQAGAGYELIYAVNRNAEKPEIPGVMFIEYGGLQWLRALATAGTVIFNARAPLFLTRRKGQTTINTWHAGGAYKKTGVSVAGAGNERVMCLSNEKNRKYFSLYLSSSEKFTETNIRQAIGYEGKILNSGMPRNDLFFDERRTAEADRKIREGLGLKKEDYLVLVAPTFRADGDGRNGNYAGFPFDKAERILREETGRKVVFLIRKHHKDPTEYPIGQGMKDVSGYDDTQELLCAADLLMTDYSSVIWDFCLLNRPAILYATDRQEYERADRGFFTPIESWPAVLCETETEIEECLRKAVREDPKDRNAKYLASMGSYEKGKACETVCREIEREQ